MIVQKILTYCLLLSGLIQLSRAVHSTFEEEEPKQPFSKSVVNETWAETKTFLQSGAKPSGSGGLNNQASRVHILVGEKNGFHYTVDGHTFSRQRIAISGEYFNDAQHRYGYANLFLVAEPSIVYYAVRPATDRMDVYVQNGYREEFYYTVYPPSPVTGYDLYDRQVNSTAVMISGPSRSVVQG